MSSRGVNVLLDRSPSIVALGSSFSPAAGQYPTSLSTGSEDSSKGAGAGGGPDSGREDGAEVSAGAKARSWSTVRAPSRSSLTYTVIRGIIIQRTTTDLMSFLVSAGLRAQVWWLDVGLFEQQAVQGVVVGSWLMVGGWTVRTAGYPGKTSE